ncbi:hypothetical protein ElyMa_001806600 [Elysia marginata]|uniref:Uncharacterized protein n=1 Tax=Elysia marginata TaxID=1093978 RepID=A0AAV4EGH7_9GAST|nr:hypothetical protein ElyMa_001806600 [Elysia marginata]
MVTRESVAEKVVGTRTSGLWSHAPDTRPGILDNAEIVTLSRKPPPFELTSTRGVSCCSRSVKRQGRSKPLILGFREFWMRLEAGWELRRGGHRICSTTTPSR